MKNNKDTAILINSLVKTVLLLCLIVITFSTAYYFVYLPTKKGDENTGRLEEATTSNQVRDYKLLEKITLPEGKELHVAKVSMSDFEWKGDYPDFSYPPTKVTNVKIQFNYSGGSADKIGAKVGTKEGIIFENVGGYVGYSYDTMEIRIPQRNEEQKKDLWVYVGDNARVHLFPYTLNQ